MVIKSNTLGKLQKIRNGNVFDSPLIFIRELLQNSQRSKAKTVKFVVDNGVLLCEDDGCGCKDPENVFTLDLSDWESTDEGYGIGFWSCLAVPEIGNVTVSSKNWKCWFDAQKLFETGDLSVNQEKYGPTDGFRVEIQSEWFDDHINEIEKYTFDIAKYLPINIYLNDVLMPHYNIFDSFKPTTFYKVYDNRFFKAKLAVSSEYFSITEMYYESRFVKNESSKMVSGVMEVKKGRLTLKEPDRTSYTKDTLYYQFADKFNECMTDLYRSFLAEYGADGADDYIEGILYHLSLKDYEKYLDFESDMLQLASKPKKINGGSKVEKEPMQVLTVNPKKFAREDSHVEQSFAAGKQAAGKNISAPKASAGIAAVVKPKSNGFRDKIKNMKKAVWVKKSEVNDYKDEIQEAKYKGLNVIVAKNELYSNALSHYGITHISELSNHFKEHYLQSNIMLKNGKEEAFMRLLQPICQKYNLPSDTFLICDLAIDYVFEVDGEVVLTHKIRNKRDHIEVYGLAGGGHIYLDRNALGLSRFALTKNGGIGIHEIKAIMANVNVISHELAHFFYKTKDNTPEHYMTEIAFQRDIIKLYL